MIPYEGGKVYGPYKRKEDNRSHVIITFPNDERVTVSYPKYLVEIQEGRYLKKNEEIHHIDENVTNNKLENLELLSGFLHRTIHSDTTPDIWTCAYCKISFLVTAEQVRRRKAELKRRRCKTGPFCSRRCSGKVNH